MQSDFVFRKVENGLEFVGDFEGLYKTQPDPWGQSAIQDGSMTAYYEYSRAHLLAAIQRHCDPNKSSFGLEVGCGHGHVCDLLQKAHPRITWEGMDISTTAVGKARLLYPRGTFFAADLTDHNFASGVYQVIILGQMLWYILHGLPEAILNCHALLRSGGILIVSQAFLDKQLYGVEVVDGFAGLVNVFLEYFYDQFTLIEARYDDTNKYVHHDGLLVFRKRD